MEKVTYDDVEDLTPDKDRIAVCEGLDGEGCDSGSRVNWWESPDGASDAICDDCVMEDTDHGGAAGAEFGMTAIENGCLVYPRIFDPWSGAFGIEGTYFNCDECEETGLKADADGTKIECGCEHTDFRKRFVENQKKWKELLDPQG